jgi:hypothetical protein
VTHAESDTLDYRQTLHALSDFFGKRVSVVATDRTAESGGLRIVLTGVLRHGTDAERLDLGHVIGNEPDAMLFMLGERAPDMGDLVALAEQADQVDIPVDVLRGVMTEALSGLARMRGEAWSAFTLRPSLFHGGQWRRDDLTGQRFLAILAGSLSFMVREHTPATGTHSGTAGDDPA